MADLSRYSGSAYRSVSYDTRMDPLLRNAALAAGIKDREIPKLFVKLRYIMFVNPGTSIFLVLESSHSRLTYPPL